MFHQSPMEILTGVWVCAGACQVLTSISGCRVQANFSPEQILYTTCVCQTVHSRPHGVDAQAYQCNVTLMSKMSMSSICVRWGWHHAPVRRLHRSHTTHAWLLRLMGPTFTSVSRRPSRNPAQGFGGSTAYCGEMHLFSPHICINCAICRSSLKNCIRRIPWVWAIILATQANNVAEHWFTHITFPTSSDCMELGMIHPVPAMWHNNVGHHICMPTFLCTYKYSDAHSHVTSLTACTLWSWQCDLCGCVCRYVM